MLRFALTIFLSAFLLFQVQPLIGKYILPWFGGTNNVWTTCLLFFQIVLLAGYFYAHMLSKMAWKKQATVHLVLLALTLPFLPISPSAGWKPGPENEPTLRILMLLLFTIGLPYLVLSTTGPLLQSWFSASHPGKSPYRLYALSNVGSLLALISFPLWVETSLSRWGQVLSWTIGFVLFLFCCGWCAWRLRKDGSASEPIWQAGAPAASATPAATTPATAAVAGDTWSGGASKPSTEPTGLPRRYGAAKLAAASGNPQSPEAPPFRDGASSRDGAAKRPSPLLILLWLALSAAGSAMLMATTNQLTGDVAVVPFLWIIPLALYLITFILCFEGEWGYIRPLQGAMLVITVPVAVYLLFEGVTAPLWLQIIGYSAAMFACCMTCHGELARSKPHPKHLTLFFLTISAGGAIGGFFVAVIAPMAFNQFLEYHVALLLCVGVTFIAWARDAYTRPSPKHAPAMGYLVALSSSAVAIVICFLLLERPITEWHDEKTGSFKSVEVLLKEFRENPNGVNAYWQDLSETRVFKPGWLETTLEEADSSWSFLGVKPVQRAGLMWSQLVRDLAIATLVAVLICVTLDEVLARRGRRPVLYLAGPTIAAVALAMLLQRHSQLERKNVIYLARNFYGVITVEKDWTYQESWTDESGNPVFEEVGPRHKLVHGRIMHGFQFMHDKAADRGYPARKWATTYYGHDSGVGLAIDQHPRRHNIIPLNRNLHIGVIGLGTGTLATYGDKGDKLRIYEINPGVLALSQKGKYFTYLKDCEDRGCKLDVVLGDARIMLERERDRKEIQGFDVLAVDAFSSDAIPIHLITEEAAKLYFEHIKPDGILALHISNRFVDLEPVTMGLGEKLGIRPMVITNDDDSGPGVSSSTWVLLTKNQEFMNDQTVKDSIDSWYWEKTVSQDNLEKIRRKSNQPQTQVGDANPLLKPHFWTDDFASLWELLDF